MKRRVGGYTGQLREEKIVATEIRQDAAAMGASLQVGSDPSTFFRRELVVKVSTEQFLDLLAVHVVPPPCSSAR